MLPQALPFVQVFAFGAAFAAPAGPSFAPSTGVDIFGSATGGASDFGAATGASVGDVDSLWQTSFFEMQLFPQGLPFLQFLASAEEANVLNVRSANTTAITNDKDKLRFTFEFLF